MHGRPAECVSGMASLVLVVMYVGYSCAKRHKQRRASIRAGTVILDAESVMPVSVVLPQEMANTVAARRPSSVSLDAFTVVQEEK